MISGNFNIVGLAWYQNFFKDGAVYIYYVGLQMYSLVASCSRRTETLKKVLWNPQNTLFSGYDYENYL